jgi:hypothetical protein
VASHARPRKSTLFARSPKDGMPVGAAFFVSLAYVDAIMSDDEG